MANMILLQSLPFASLGGGRGAGFANLGSPDPKEVWQDTTVGSAVSLVADLGAVQTIDTVYLGFHNGAPASTWLIEHGTTAPNQAVFQTSRTLPAPSDYAGARGHSLAVRSSTVSARHVQLTLLQPAGSAPLFAGVLMIGRRFQPTWNHEVGDGRVPLDLGSVERLRGGGFGRRAGAIKWGCEWTFGDLTDAELVSIAGLVGHPLTGAGVSGPVLVCEDPDTSSGLAERIHYGLLTGLERFSRDVPGVRARWRLQHEEWV